MVSNGGGGNEQLSYLSQLTAETAAEQLNSTSLTPATTTNSSPSNSQGSSKDENRNHKPHQVNGQGRPGQRPKSGGSRASSKTPPNGASEHLHGGNTKRP